MKKKIKSPCQLVCTYNESGICVGCYRSADEVLNWEKMTEEEKKDVIKKTQKRKAEMENTDYYGFFG
ncbi:MAG: DUF1289 domain-containing protein [Bacteroidales bacterium]